MNIPFIYVYLRFFLIDFIKCLCILHTRYNTIHDTEKLKIDLRYDSRFNNYGYM